MTVISFSYGYMTIFHVFNRRIVNDNLEYWTQNISAIKCHIFQGKVVNYFIPSYCPRGKVKSREIQDTEYEPKEKVHCPRKYGLFK